MKNWKELGSIISTQFQPHPCLVPIGNILWTAKTAHIALGFRSFTGNIGAGLNLVLKKHHLRDGSSRRVCVSRPLMEPIPWLNWLTFLPLGILTLDLSPPNFFFTPAHSDPCSGWSPCALVLVSQTIIHTTALFNLTKKQV